LTETPPYQSLRCTPRTDTSFMGPLVDLHTPGIAKDLDEYINPPQHVITVRVRKISRWLSEEFGVCTVMSCQRRYGAIYHSGVESADILRVWRSWHYGKIYIDKTGHEWFSFEEPPTPEDLPNIPPK